MKCAIDSDCTAEYTDFIQNGGVCLLTLYRLLSFFDGLPTGDTYRGAAATILNHLREIPEISIEKLAELSFSSPTTLNRLVRRLGCASFSEFKRDIRDALDSYDMNIYRMLGHDLLIEPTPSNYFSWRREHIDMLETIPVTLLKQICTELHAHQRIRFYADVRDCCIGPDIRQLQMDLVLDGKDTAFLYDPTSCVADAKTLDSDSLVILPCSTYLPAFQQTLTVAKLAKERNAFTVVFAEKYTPRIKEYSDILVEFEQVIGTSEGHIVKDLLLVLSLLYAK